MNWISVGVASWVVLGMEVGLRDAFQLGTNDVTPHFAVVLVAFVSAWARRRQAMWHALAMGVLLDLLTNVPLATGETVTVVGPNALGMLCGAYFAYLLRAWMYRRHVLAIAFLSVGAALVSGVVALALVRARGVFEPVQTGSAASALGRAGLSALYTGLAALPLAWLLGLIRPVFGFPTVGRSGSGR